MPEEQINPPRINPPRINADSISYQSSKAEIWKKYKELKEGGEQKPRIESAPQEKAAPSSDVMGSVFDEVNRLRVKISQALSSLTDAFVKEAEKLVKLRQEIEEKKEELKGLYDIEAKASTLELLKQDEERERVKWEEENARVALMRKREEENYQYGIKRKRQELEDEFSQLKKNKERELQEKKRALEDEIALQNAALKQKEKEIAEQHKNLEKEAKELKETFAKTEHALRQEMQEKMTHEKELNKQNVTALQETIARQDKEIVALRQQLQKALEQIRDMAVGVFHTQERTPQK